MATQTKIESCIPALYKRSSLNHLMFGFITGVRATLHTITIKDAVYMFMKEYGLDDDDFNSDSALVTFNRMQSELLTIKREK